LLAAFPDTLPASSIQTAPGIGPIEEIFMRILALLAGVAALTALSACDEEATCTQETLTAKTTDLTTALSTLATTDAARATEVTTRMQEIATAAAANGADLQEACDALDAMLAEISG
jgi:hypothetical protein